MLTIGLLSGGLDSSLAVKLVLEQGIDVVAIKFTSPFCNCDSGGRCHAAEIAEELGIELVTVVKGQDYLDIVKDPRFGRGSGMNPCIDCRIYALQKAKQLADERGGKFIFTGEVLGQRPMSQHRKALRLIEKESGLEGKLLRPLSAKLLPPTEAEKNGWIDRERLLGISGRSRKVQMGLAKDKGINDYPCPGGGCLLTDKEFSVRLRDHLEHNEGLTYRDVAILKVGRHFRVGSSKIVIGRNEKENRFLTSNAKDWTIIEPCGIPGPTALVSRPGEQAIEVAAGMVARYSDNGGGSVQIRILNHREHTKSVAPLGTIDIESYRLGVS